MTPPHALTAPDRRLLRQVTRCSRGGCPCETIARQIADLGALHPAALLLGAGALLNEALEDGLLRPDQVGLTLARAAALLTPKPRPRPAGDHIARAATHYTETGHEVL